MGFKTTTKRILLIPIVVAILLLGYMTFPSSPSVETVASTATSSSTQPTPFLVTQADWDTIPTTTTLPPPPTTKKPERVIPPKPSRSRAPVGDVWRALGNCESGNNPRSVGGGGRYFGAFQMTPGSWGRFGNGGAILEQSWGEQQAAAARQQAAEGWGPWPHCARKLGLL